MYRQEQERHERMVQEVVDQDTKQVLDVKMEPPYGNGTSNAAGQRLGNAPDNELEQAKLRKRPRLSTSNDNDKTDFRTRLVEELISSIGVKPEPETAPKPSMNSSDGSGPPGNAVPVADVIRAEEHASPASERTRKRARLAPVDPTQSSVSNAGMAPRPQPEERVSIVHTSRASAFNEPNTADHKPVLLTQNRSLKPTGSMQPASMAKRQAVPDMVKDMALNPVLFKNLTFSHDVQSGYEAMEAAITGSGGRLISLDDVRSGANVDYLISRM